MVKIRSNLTSANSFHPKIITYIEFDKEDERPSEDCQLDLVYELPASVFVDPYQLQDLESSIGKATVFGEHDLELPLEKVKEPQGSLVFLRQTSSSPVVELPIHNRYQRPASDKIYQSVTIQPPYAGWTCGRAPWPVLDHPLLPKTEAYPQFIPLHTSQQDSLTLFVPVGRVQDRQWVTLGTFCVVVWCTVWIASSIMLSVKKRKRTEAKGKRRKSD